MFPGINVPHSNNCIDLRLLECAELEGDDQFIFDLNGSIARYGNTQTTQGNIFNKAVFSLFPRFRSLPVASLNTYFFSIRLSEFQINEKGV
jgi:hypothetical protein